MKNNATIIEHYFIGQQIEVKDLVRHLGNGTPIVINGVGIINSIMGCDGDIQYEVEFTIPITRTNSYGKTWTKNKNRFFVRHNEDKQNIINVLNYATI